MSESLEVCVGIASPAKFSLENLSLTDSQERLRSHAKAFDGLLQLIPAKLYYGEDTSVSCAITSFQPTVLPQVDTC